MKVGFIGLGIMGSRMAANLQKNGYQLYLYNRSKEKGQDLEEKGAKMMASPAEVAKNADVVFTVLADPEAVRQLAIGEQGIVENLQPGKYWVNCTTVNPSFAREIGQLAASFGIHYLDAPVAGTKGPAEKGELVFLLGGKEEHVNHLSEFWDILGKTYNHVGEIGMGSSMKMVINLMLGHAMTAFSEALVLGQSMGIDKEKLMETLVGGPVTAPFLAGKKDKIANHDFDPEFPLQWMHKDMHLVRQTAYENKVALPSSAVIEELYALAKQKGYGEDDFSVIYQFLINKEI